VTDFECALDQGEFFSCTSPYEIAGPLGGGPHVFHVRAVDPDLNRDPSPAFYEWLIVGPPDTTAPETYITVHPDPENSGPDVTFAFASNEPTSGFECAWGDGTPPAAPTTWEECEVVWLLESLDSGEHWLWVRALDAAVIPNVDPTPAGQDLGFGPNDTDPFVWVTTGEPDTIIDSGPDDPTGALTATFTFHSDQPGATFMCSVNGSPAVGCTSPFQAGPFLPGEGGEPMEHEFEVYAVNQYRNADGEQVMDLSPAVYAWTVQDVTAPDTEFLAAVEIGPEQFLEPGIRFTFRGIDDLASSFDLTFECAITLAGEAEAWEECGEPAADDSFFHEIAIADYLESPGTYTFQVRAVDLSDNPDPTPAPDPAYTFAIEAEPETTLLTVAPDMGIDLETTGTSVTFTFSGTGASFLCALDTTTFTPCTSPQPYTDVPYGEHLFQIMAVGALGTPDATPAEFEWVSGTDVAPDVSINLATAPATGGTATSGTIEFNSSDPQALFRCMLDGVLVQCAEPGYAYSDLLAGAQNPHTFEVEAYRADLLPSVTTNVDIHEWVIADETAPTAILLLPLPADPSANEVEFRFTGTDNGTLPANLEFQCSLDSAAFVGCSSPAQLADLSGGPHTFSVRAIDETDLVGEPVSHGWTVIAPPATAITNTTPLAIVADGAISVSATGELSFFDQPGSTYECRLDPVSDVLPAFAPCDSPFEYDLANGTHVFEVRATTLPLDGQVMIEVPAAEHEWTIDAADATDPDTTILLGPASPTANTTATFIFGGSDNLTASADLTYECSLNGAAFVPCESGDVYSGLVPATYTLEVAAVDSALVPNVDGTPAAHTWTIDAPGAANTSGPDNLTVATGGAIITFESVTQAGTTSVSTLYVDSSIVLPNGYTLPAGAVVYDVSTTATFVGDVTVCLPYDAVVDAHLLHFDGSEWVDVTLELQGSLVCGVVSSLSPFAVVEVSTSIAPDTTIVQAPADPTIQTTAAGANVQFQFTSPLPLSDFECALDGAEWSSCDTPLQFEALFGQHTLHVRAVSETGVRDVSPASHTWTVLARPMATIDLEPADEDPVELGVQTDNQSATFEFSSDQTGSTFECSLAGETTATGWVSCTSPETYDDLAIDEEYTFEVRAISAAGHASFVPAQFEWEILDLTAPTVSITAGPSGTVDQTTAQFVFSADQPATFECSIDGAPFGACASGTTYTGFGLGTHTFDVQATDLSERENLGATVTRTWTVADQTAPNLAIGQKPAATTSDTAATFTFSATDNWPGAISFACRLDGGALAACASPIGYSGLSAEEHTFEVTATDVAGNVESETWTWTVEDVVDPEAEITNMTTGSLIFEFTGTDDHTATADLAFECRVDTGAWSTCTSPKTYSSAELAAMTPGDHTFHVRAIDEADNVGQPDNRTFTVADTTAPNTQLTGQPANNTTNTDATFTFTGADDGTAAGNLSFACALDGGGFTACISPKAYSGLAIGEHTFEVRATDAATNTDLSPASYTWTIVAPADTTTPETTLTSQPPASTTETNASFGFTATEAGSTFECRIDAGAWVACTSPQAYSGLATGSHTFSVRATDAAGNTDQSAATFTWTVQSTTVTCPAPVTLTATADSWIDSGSTTSNKGSDSILKVMSKSGGNLRALVRFTLPTLPQGCSVEDATLRMYAKSAANNRSLEAIQLNGTWTEGGVTWANQPTTTGAAATTASGTGYREWDVALQVQGMYTGTNNGFLIRDAVENQDAEQQFHAREESSNRPQLVITFSAGAPPPPPPGESDPSAPDTTITGSPGAASSSTSADFTFTGLDNVTATGALLFECQLDVPVTSAWTACTSPQSFSSLSVGSHTFRVRARDEANNVDASPAVHTWTIDQTAPETVITGGPSASTTDTSAAFAFQSPETGTTFACSLDQGVFTACSSPKSYTGLAVGQHTFRVQAVDAAGNVDATPASYPWTIQTGGTPVNCGSSVTASANADSWIEQSSPSSNKGTDSILKVMSKSGNSNLRALVRFTLPTMPAGCVIDTATLRLYAGSSKSGRTLQALRLTATWTENGVTWANQPTTSGAAATVASGSGYRQWNVASIVQAMYSSGANHGFLIRDASENQDAEQQFYAKEKGEQPPQLVLTFKPASGSAAPGAPFAPAACVDSCTASVGGTLSIQPAAIQIAGAIGSLMSLTLALAYMRSLIGRRPPRPPVTT
jgi:hypothetical protein